MGNCGFPPERVGSVPGKRLEAAFGHEVAGSTEALSSGCA
jgi:hypothetical protein